jgi:hypothetical protein
VFRVVVIVRIEVEFVFTYAELKPTVDAGGCPRRVRRTVCAGDPHIFTGTEKAAAEPSVTLTEDGTIGPTAKSKRATIVNLNPTTWKAVPPFAVTFIE